MKNDLRQVSLVDIDLSQEEIESVVKVMQSKWLTVGDITDEFEKEFAGLIKVKHAFAVSSCTAALHIANSALDIMKGDEVICPALTFVATANASRYTGAEVVFADCVSEKDLTIDPVDIEQKITSKTKAISVVHYAGFPCFMETIMAIAKKYELKVIEDCAHSPFAWTGTSENKKYLGTIGDVGCFSFYGNKNMTTGEGGMVVTNNDKIADKLKVLRSHGMTKMTMDKTDGHASLYDVVSMGYNYRIDEIRSAIGLIQLKKIKNNNEKRRKVFKLYTDILSANENIIVPFSERDISQSTPHIMPVMIKNDYEKIKQKLTDAGIQTSKHYDLVPSFSLYGNKRFRSKLKYINNLISLPMHQNISSEDITYIASTLKQQGRF
jgi:dTDP-4-amino-4,6-dideoxygalactose transaminase